MKKIIVTTWYQIDLPDGESRSFKAETYGTYNEAESPLLKTLLDLHSEKTGSIERKLIKDHE